MRNGFIIAAIMIAGLLWLGGAFEPSKPKPPAAADAQYGDLIIANVETVACDSEEELSGTRRNCISVKMASTGKAIKTYGKVGACVRWQGRESGCLWSPRSELLFIPADKAK